MLILVGVTVNVALNGGLFDKAKEATLLHEVASIKEAIEINKKENEDLYGDIDVVLGSQYSKYKDKYKIEGNSLVYVEGNLTNKEIEILENNGIEKSGKYYLIMNENTKQEKYLEVENAITLKELNTKIAQKQFIKNNYNKAYIIEDLDLGAKWNEDGDLTEGESWKPIDTIPEGTILDGKGYSIIGMHIKTDTSGGMGLIKSNKGTIRNIKLEKQNYLYSSVAKIAGVCYSNTGYILNCENNIDITAPKGQIIWNMGRNSID